MLSQNTYWSMNWIWRLILESERCSIWSTQCFFDLLTSNSVSLLTLLSITRVSFSYLHGPSNYQTAVSKETTVLRQKNQAGERERGWREREGTARGKWLAEILFYPRSFYTLCFQCLPGSWLGRPRCFLLSLLQSAHTRAFVTVTKWLSFWNVPLSYFLFFSFFFLYLLPFWNVALPDGQMSVFSHCRNKAVMASHLLQYLGQAAEVSVGKMLGLPQVQDNSCRTWFGGKVVQIPEWNIVTKQRRMI